MEKARGGEWTAALRGPLSSSPKKAPHPRGPSSWLAPVLPLSGYPRRGWGWGTLWTSVLDRCFFLEGGCAITEAHQQG